VPTKKPDHKGRPKRASPAKHDADTAEVAFDEVIDAILGADPEAVRGQKERRRRKKQATKRPS